MDTGAGFFVVGEDGFEGVEDDFGELDVLEGNEVTPSVLYEAFFQEKNPP